MLALSLTLALNALAAPSQKAPEPRREQLLNGLRVLLVQRPADQQVLVRMRVHSGAAFDLAGKEGLMSLLAEAMFDPEDFRFVEEDLGGKLEVEVAYDAIDVTAKAPAAAFPRVLEMLRAGVMNVQLTPDAVARLREERVRRMSGETVTQAETADRHVAARLFTPHPYARVKAGTPESIARIEYSDMILARERFINPNNTTLVIIGGVDPRGVMRQLRQSLGGWRKSDQVVPATFRLPEPPDARTLVVNQPGASGFEVRLALRGMARTDRDRAAAELLAVLARENWLAASPELKNAKALVEHRSHRDGGIFRLGASLGTAAEAAKALASARAVLQELAARPVPVAQFETARQALAATLSHAAQGDEAWVDAWLDAHTYNSEAAWDAEVARALHALTPADVQRVAARLFQNTPSAAVAVGDAALLREELARGGVGVEVFGEPSTQAAAPLAQPAKPEKEAQKQPVIQLKRPW
jgi:predicted Zn-dependent peptidase